MTSKPLSTQTSGERFVVLLHAMYAIADHATDVDCDGECVEWMNGHAVEALRIFFGSEDWTYADIARAVADLRGGDSPLRQRKSVT